MKGFGKVDKGDFVVLTVASLGVPSATIGIVYLFYQLLTHLTLRL